ERSKRFPGYPADKAKLKCPNAKPFLKDQTKHLNPPLGAVSNLEHADRNKRDVLSTAAKGVQRDFKLGAKPSSRAGHAAQQTSSNTARRAAVARPEQPRGSAKPPVGLAPGTTHATQPRGRLPASTSGHPNPERNKKAAQGTVTTAGPRAAPGAPRSRNDGLQDRLVSNKENIRAQSSARPGLNRAAQPDRSKGVLAHGHSSATTSRAVMGPKDRVNNHQAKKEPIQDKIRKALPGLKSTSQKPAVKTQPLQPPRLLTGSTHSLHKKPGPNQEETGTAREPVGKPLGIRPAGSIQQHSRPSQMERPPTKPPGSSRPPGTSNLKPSLKPGGTAQWQRPMAKGQADRRDGKGAPPGCAAAPRVTVPPDRPRSTHSSRTPAIESNLRSRGDRLKSEVPKASRVMARCVPKHPSPADRKKQLEEWLASKGKTYKRPPMTLLQKQAVKLSWRSVKEKEKQEKPEQQEEPEQLCLEKINSVLTECLTLAEEGVSAEELSALLSQVPHAEKFAKFWICKAKLLARSGPFDVTGLYRAAVCAGAVPLQELREVVLDILKAADQTSEALPSLPPSIKLQVTSASRGKEPLEGPELKFVTPVRRSLRVERAGSRYPEMLKDHDPVVSSLSEILDAEEDTQFLFRKNEALPEVVELEGVSLCPPERC
ncbi:PREDICTED: cytoskeleton-associated protein 2-like, partial [Mesitornis unicolor]|uniref:cytoskeleton-associated protein 2-like n=1 Tax=Mesitornis unicolor TaxID=54374 RepID=UPI0005283027